MVVKTGPFPQFDVIVCPEAQCRANARPATDRLPAGETAAKDDGVNSMASMPDAAEAGRAESAPALHALMAVRLPSSSCFVRMWIRRRSRSCHLFTYQIRYDMHAHGLIF
jgi:hypothetical protein